jgi:hypothetical protein
MRKRKSDILPDDGNVVGIESVKKKKIPRASGRWFYILSRGPRIYQDKVGTHEVRNPGLSIGCSL